MWQRPRKGAMVQETHLDSKSVEKDFQVAGRFTELIAAFFGEDPPVIDTAQHGLLTRWRTS